MENNYFAMIPILVLRDERLSSTAKLLYGEISSLTNMLGYCFATNNYLANLQNISKTTVSQAISKLQELEYITIEMIYEPESKQIKERRIYPFIEISMLKNLNTSDKKLTAPISKNLNPPIIENLKDNSITDNKINYKYNINNNLKNLISKQELEFVSNEYKIPFYEWVKFKKEQFNFEYKSIESLQKLYNQLIKYSNNDPKLATTVVENSIAGGYKGLFPLKEVNNANSSRNSKSNDKELSSYERSRRLTVADIEKSRAEFIANLENTKSVFE